MEPFGARVILAAFRTNVSNVNFVILLYCAPTNDSDEETKETFYDKLQTVLEKTKDFTFVMGISMQRSVRTATLKTSDGRDERKCLYLCKHVRKDLAIDGTFFHIRESTGQLGARQTVRKSNRLHLYSM